MSKIPWSNNAATTDNETECRLVGQIPLEAAASLLYFQKGNVAQSIIHQIKYHGNTQLAHQYGHLLGNTLKESGRFDTIDYIVPVPLHWLRQLRRGYNQSQLLALAISDDLNVPVADKNLYRHLYTSSQTHKDRQQRTQNVSSAFRVRHPEKLAGKHILLIDDVITTGATIEACYHALESIPDIKISITALAITTL
ncbi:MAG: ComF family protein [Bacteroidales bacterium]|nr:ComF family protein [Bacteroidales bacterium]MBR3411458.1 ComF family protein [Bacteroidales bacterium]